MTCARRQRSSGSRPASRKPTYRCTVLRSEPASSAADEAQRVRSNVPNISMISSFFLVKTLPPSLASTSTTTFRPSMEARSDGQEREFRCPSTGRSGVRQWGLFCPPTGRMTYPPSPSVGSVSRRFEAKPKLLRRASAQAAATATMNVHRSVMPCAIVATWASVRAALAADKALVNRLTATSSVL